MTARRTGNQWTIKHRMSGTPEYSAWSGMRARCRRLDLPGYGGRGVAVCARWEESFANFFADMGARPSPLHSIDRIDVNGNYEPSNCRWATAKEQMRNRRVTRAVEVDGVRRPLLTVCEERGMNYQMVYARIATYGWPEQEALAGTKRRNPRRQA